MSNRKKYNLWVGLIFSVLALTTFFSCNKDFSRVLPDKEYLDTATVSFGNPKVLYLIVDGARGTSVKDATTPNIDALLPHSIYSWVALSDPDSTNDATNWASLLTGVAKEKSKVYNTNFDNNNLQNYPVFFSRIKEIKPHAKIVSYSASPLLKDNLTAGADIKESFATDEEVKTAVVNNLNTDTASLVVGQFKAIDKAGEQYGYDNSFAPYKAAIEKFDGYVGEMMTAIQKRPNYKNEEWLVVIASSGGGKFTSTDDDNTVFSNTEVNTFIIYHNLKYKQRIITKPFTGNRYLGKTIKFSDTITARIDTADIFNLSDTIKFTIELKVKKNEDKFFTPSILAKRKEWSNGHPGVGWAIYLENDYWVFDCRGAKDVNFRQARGGVLQKGRWQTLSVKGEIRAGRRFVRTYTDGNFNSEIDITDAGSISNNFPLTLGYLKGKDMGTPNVFLSDVRFFLTSVPDASINRYACETAIDQSHPYYTFLAGYWPATDGEGNVFRDLGPQARDFKLIGNYNWENFNDLICPPPTGFLATTVPRSFDVPVQIINWFKISIKSVWDLDGRVWLDQ